MKRISKTRRKPITEIGRLRIGLSLAWLFVLLLLLFTGSCTQTEVEEDVIPPHALKDVDAGFNLNVLATRTPVTRSITFMSDGTIESDTLAVGAKDSVQTKAANPLEEDQESQIASLWVGQYDATSGKLLFNQYISSMTGTTVNLKLKQSQNKSKSRVYFVSNAGDLGAIADETTLKKHTLPYASSGAGLPENSLCKMVGKWEGEVVAGGVKDITVNLTRLLAKITFTYSMGADFTFTPTSVELINAPTVSQVEAPAGQLTTGSISYTNYTGTADDKGATVYWYLPENMAGTVSGANVVDSEKKKIGKGVTNATYIKLNGNAVQGGVTYEDVTFRFYPGSDKNNYDILRNAHYTMAVTLVGIDVSDERITVGKIPDIEVDPTEMPAKKGGEKEIQITARPGQEWVFDMPSWLSALLDGKTIPSGATITHQGPATVVFQAVEANSRAEKREVSFKIKVNGTDQNVTITQAGSTLTKGSDISLAALANAEGSSSFMATEGLQWSAVLNDGDGWLSWAPTNPGDWGEEAPAGAQALKVKTTAGNPSAQERSGKIVVKAGASVGEPNYNGLKQEIAVKQAGSTVSGSTVNVNAEAAGAQSSFTATAGLDWALSVANGSWITLTGSSSGSPTTGNAQNVTFDVAVNPSSSQRTNDITVRAGDASSGPTNNITVTQAGAALSVSEANTVAATASTTDYTSTFSATKGLSWNVSDNMDWLTLTSTISGANNTTGVNQDIKYSVVVNPNASTRNGNITVKAGNAVSGTDAGLTKTITVTQSASTFGRTNPTSKIAAAANSTTTGYITATEGLGWTISPVSDNGITVSPTSGTGNETLTFKGEANTGAERTGTFIISVTNASPARTATITATQIASETAGETGAYVGKLQVCKTDEGKSNWSTANTNCNNSTKEGKSNWRLPTVAELRTMYSNKSSLEAVSGFTAFPTAYHWSSDYYNSAAHYIVGLGSGGTTDGNNVATYYVRCVRDK